MGRAVRKNATQGPRGGIENPAGPPTVVYNGDARETRGDFHRSTMVYNGNARAPRGDLLPFYIGLQWERPRDRPPTEAVYRGLHWKRPHERRSSWGRLQCSTMETLGAGSWALGPGSGTWVCSLKALALD